MGVLEYEKEAAHVLAKNKSGTYVDEGDFNSLVAEEVRQINLRVVTALTQFKERP